MSGVVPNTRGRDTSDRTGVPGVVKVSLDYFGATSALQRRTYRTGRNKNYGLEQGVLSFRVSSLRRGPVQRLTHGLSGLLFSGPQKGDKDDT